MKEVNAQGNIKYFLKNHGIKQKYIAEQIGLAEADLSLKLNNKRLMTVSELVKIANVLSVTPNELLGIS